MDFSMKRAMIIVVGADVIKEINLCLKNITDNFCKILGIPVVTKKSFRSNSELKGNYQDIFENKLNSNLEKELEKMAKKLCRSLKR